MIRPLTLLLLLASCTAGTPTPQAQRVIDVLCAGDALAQPIVVPVIVAILPVTSPAATIDQLLVHPEIVAACARYASKPVAIVPAGPAGATVAPALTLVAP